MTIIWTKCSERMPDNKDVIIVKGELEGDYVFTTGLRLKVYLASCGDAWHRVKISFQTYWTPYTPEVWEELNRCLRE